jgi:D-alanyl-D-alanine carboxypeptidase
MAAAFQTALNDWAASDRHRGVSAAVILPNGAEWVSTAGIEGLGRPLLPDHLIVIASITKTMTGAVILQLAEEGRLDLDDAISRWLEPRPNIDPNITIRQLLNHTNGLANYTTNGDLVAAINADPAHVFTAEELLEFVGPRSFAPGERTEYTNTSFLLLGMIAQAATGVPITTLYHERVWGPTGLTEIFLPGAEGPAGPVARAWSGQPPAQSEVDPLERMSLLSVGNSAFGLYSNARTVARWGHALFAGKVLGDRMRAEMLEFVPAAGNIFGESGAGLGIRKYSYLGREQWGHSGGASLGSSLLLFDPATKTTVVVIMNQGSGADHFVLAPRLLEIATSGEP